jgi:8-oxo-dGTP pyrophosphatase MutT (NUDIX family)
MKYNNIQNNIILEGTWGLGKTTVAKEFAKRFNYLFIPEPSHLEAEKNEDLTNLQTWYRSAHLKQEKYFAHSGVEPCILERSILSVFAFEYALYQALPSLSEMARLREVLAQSKTLLVYLTPESESYDALKQSCRVGENIQSILANKEALDRYFKFYSSILPWKYDIVPLILPSIDERINRDAIRVASEIHSALEAQRVGQVNVICLDTAISMKDPRILIMHRVPNRGGFWQTVTGGIHPGEPLTLAAAREVLEEVEIGLTSNDLMPTHYVHSFLGNDGYRLTEYVFTGLIKQRQDICSSKEHDEMRWVSIDEAKNLMYYESNRIALDHAIEVLK